MHGGAALALSAQWIPWILGPSFDAAVPAVLMLAALPAVQVFRWMLGTSMTALNLHRHFFLVHGLGALTSVLLIAGLAPAFGIAGAIGAAYGTETVLIFVQGWILLRNRSNALHTLTTSSR
jgi:O-antigen/teichoic acid export membrane protein